MSLSPTVAYFSVVRSESCYGQAILSFCFLLPHGVFLEGRLKQLGDFSGASSPSIGRKRNAQGLENVLLVAGIKVEGNIERISVEQAAMEDVFNTPQTCKVELEVLGHKLLLAQDPNSQHLGTTIWDSSVVFVKYLEKNSKKGEFSRAKLHNKRVVEVGAGCGLSGLGMALLGCDVVVTDQAEVLPLLRRNMERNMAQAKYSASEYSHLGPIGSVEVAELDWGNQKQAEVLIPPFDYIIGTDVVYKEHLLPPLLESVLALSGPKTTLLLGYEFRASGVKEQLQELFSRHFSIKKIAHSKMDVKYQHSNIDLYIMRLIRLDAPAPEEDKSLAEQECASPQKPSASSLEPDEADCNTFLDSGACSATASNEPSLKEIREIVRGGSFPDPDETQASMGERWEAGRAGSMAARLLRDVEVPSS